MSKAQRYYIEYLQWRGRPASVGEIVSAFERCPESPRLAATEGPFLERKASHNKARWNSANRSLNGLVKKGDLVKVVSGKGSKSVLFGFPFDQFRFRHHYKTLALDQLAKQYLSPDHYKQIRDSGATAKQLVNAIQGPSGLSPDAMTVVLAALVEALDPKDGYA